MRLSTNTYRHTVQPENPRFPPGKGRMTAAPSMLLAWDRCTRCAAALCTERGEQRVVARMRGRKDDCGGVKLDLVLDWFCLCCARTRAEAGWRSSATAGRQRRECLGGAVGSGKRKDLLLQRADDGYCMDPPRGCYFARGTKACNHSFPHLSLPLPSQIPPKPQIPNLRPDLCVCPLSKC